MGRSLKNFEIYFDKLLAYAEACDVTVEYHPGTEGEYSPANRKIKLDPEEEESTILAVFMHELGHLLDDSVREENEPLDEAYKACYKETATAEQMQLVMECEGRAWLYGKGVAKKLRIPLGKWFNEEEVACLNGYKETNDEEEREVGS